MADPISAAIAAIVSSAAFGTDAALGAIGLGAIAAPAGAFVGTALSALGFQSGLLAGLMAWGAVASVAGVFGTPKVGGTHDQMVWEANPYAAVPYIIGETGARGKVIYEKRLGDDDENHMTITCFGGPGPYEGLVSVSFPNPVDGAQDDPPITVAFDSDGNALTSPFDGHMWTRTVVGDFPQSAMTQPPDYPGPDFTEWTSAHKLNSLAAMMLITDGDPGVYETTDTMQPTWKWRGALSYDPRLDPERFPDWADPGGTHRWADPRTDPDGYETARHTWSFSKDPWLNALNLALGKWARDPDAVDADWVLVQGIGVRIERIDVHAFADAANVSEANGWEAGGELASADSQNGDSPYQSLLSLCQAGGGKPVPAGGILTCNVQTPRVSIATLTGKDFAGEGASISGTKPRRDKINQVFPSYRSEEHGWQIVTADPIIYDASGPTDYVTADRGRRPKPITYPMVQNKDQAAQLAGYDIEDSHERGPFSLPGKTAMSRFLPGDCVTLDDPEFGLGGATKCIVIQRSVDVMAGLFPLTFQTETDAKHTRALALTGTAPPV